MIKFSRYFQNALKTDTFKQSSVTFSGTVINGILGIIFYGYVAHLLAPAQFGIFFLATSVLTFVSDIVDFGSRTGLVRFVSKYLKDEKDKAYKYLKITLEFKFLIGFLFSIIGWFAAPFLAILIFKKPEMSLPLQISFAGVFGVSLYSFSIAALQAYQKFIAWSGLQIVTNLLRLMIIFLLVSISAFNLSNSLLVYIMMPLLGFLASFLFFPRSFFKVKNESSVTKELFHYSKWVGAFSILAAISSRMDVFISGRLLSSFDIGIYGVATQLVMIIPQIISSITTVIAPKMSEMGTKSELVTYLKKSQLLVLGLALVGLLAIPISFLAIPIIYGQAFTSAVPIFIVLLLGMLIFLISIPIHNVIIYYYSYPRFFFWLSIGHLLIEGFLGWILISMYGAMGAAVTVLVGTIFNFLVPLYWGIKKIKND